MDLGLRSRLLPAEYAVVLGVSKTPDAARSASQGSLANLSKCLRRPDFDGLSGAHIGSIK